LCYSLDRLVEQISRRPAGEIELVIADDCSTDNTRKLVEPYAKHYEFVEYFCYAENIGLEENLLQAGSSCTGEYLWIFGDDDFLEHDSSLDKIMGFLSTNKYDMLIMNRTRRNVDLSNLITTNWMEMDESKEIEYSGLRDFVLDWGLLSVIGFITVNIFRREAFYSINKEPYFGTMYPQLGMMAEAFHDASCLLIGRPLICHRTHSAEEKAKAFKNKDKEKDFMTNASRRDALYFGFPLIKFLQNLIDTTSFTVSDINAIKENTVIDGRLIDFVVNNIEAAYRIGRPITEYEGELAADFFRSAALDSSQRYRLSRYRYMDECESDASPRSGLSVSVVTPSFNQAKYLPATLDSVFEQNVIPCEHIVLDPGSTDGSREIARNYKHVTLIEEADEGQGDAVAKGIARAKGDVIAWINSDDLYFNNHVFFDVLERMEKNDTPDIVYGKGWFVGEDGQKQRDVYINKKPETLTWRLQQEDGILQPSVFIKKSVFDDVGEISKHLEYCMDYEFWIRCIKEGKNFVFIDKEFVKAHFHIENKTFGQRGNSYKQVCEMLYAQFGYVNHKWLWRYAEYNVEGFDGVIEHGGNREVQLKGQLQLEYVKLMKDYNTSAGVASMLASKKSEQGYRDTYRELQELKLLPSSIYKEVDVSTKSLPGYDCYNMGDKRWAFKSKWRKSQIDKTHDFFRSEQKSRTTDTCVIVCNGPSLNKVDLELLDGHDVIVCNNIFLNEDIIRRAKYYTVVNYLVAEQSAPFINRLSDIKKIIPWWMGYCINDNRNTYFVDALGRPEFSTDIFANISWRHTVTFYNMQLAYGLGYKKVILVGCDHSYQQSNEAKEADIIDQEKDDNNHFDPRYFKGQQWQAADVDMMERMYELAKEAFDADGRSIVNCTDGGFLELFPRGNLKEQLLDAKYEGGGVIFDRQLQVDNKYDLDNYEFLSCLLGRNRWKQSIAMSVGGEHDTVIPGVKRFMHNKALVDIDPTETPILLELHSAVLVGTDTALINTIKSIKPESLILHLEPFGNTSHEEMDKLITKICNLNYAVYFVERETTGRLLRVLSAQDAEVSDCSEQMDIIAVPQDSDALRARYWLKEIVMQSVVEKNDNKETGAMVGTIESKKKGGIISKLRGKVNRARLRAFAKTSLGFYSSIFGLITLALLVMGEALGLLMVYALFEIGGLSVDLAISLLLGLALTGAGVSVYIPMLMARISNNAIDAMNSRVIAPLKSQYILPVSKRQKFVEDRASMLEKNITSIKSQAKKNSKETASLGRLNSELSYDVGGLKNKVEKLIDADKSLGELIGNVEKTQIKDIASQWSMITASSTNGDKYQRFRRRIKNTDIKLLVDYWGDRLGLELMAAEMAYLADIVCEVERQCAGRLATNIEDALLRLVVVMASSKKEISYLEIGVLFGINFISIYESLKHTRSELSFTAVDPFGGYYDKGDLDIVTKVPVSEDVFKSNLSRMDVDQADITILKGYSEDKAIIDSVPDNSLSCILIDGDHSYKGVKQDYQNYLQKVKSGGYIIIDDYGVVKEWPEITQFVDEEVKADPRVEIVGTMWRTAVFRKVTA
jgi:glycosyltransferase involved in cell wall biosynthesis/predicted O-methyltransferase YrrM